MGRFIGGSAFAMAREIAEGYIVVTFPMLKRLSRNELQQLQFEIERLLTTLRAEQYPVDDVLSIQRRNRKIGRLTQVGRMINTLLQPRSSV